MEKEKKRENVEIEAPRRIKKRYVFSVFLMIALIVGTFVFLLRGYDLKEVFEIIKTSRKRYLLLAALMPLLFLFFQSLSTWAITKRLQCNTGLWKNVTYTAVDFYFSAITPSATGGQPLVAYYMKKDGIPISKSTITLLLNTAAYKLVLIFLGIFVMIFSPNILFNNGVALIVLFFIGMFLNGFLCSLCLSGIFAHRIIYKIGRKILVLLHKMHIIKDFDRSIVGFQYKLKEYAKGGAFIKKNPLVFLEIFIYNVLQRVAMFSVAYFVYKSFMINEEGYLFLLSIQIIVAISVDTLPLPGGVGLSEGLMLLLYELIYVAEVVMPAMILTRFIGFYACIAITGILVLLNQIRIMLVKKISKKEE